MLATIVTPETEVRGILEYVRSNKSESSWGLFNNLWERMTTEHGGDRALKFVLELAYDEFPYDEYERRFEVMAQRVIDACQAQLNLLNADQYTDEGDFLDFEALKPAAIYRKFALPLRYVISKGFGNEDARMTLQDLLEEQSMPLDELDNPDWVDPYTGEFDGEAEPFMSMKPEVFVQNYIGPITYREYLLEIVQPASMQASEGFDNDADEIEVFADETDVIKPMFMLMQEDLTRSADFGHLKQEGYSVAQALRETIDSAISVQQYIASLELMNKVKGYVSDANLEAACLDIIVENKLKFSSTALREDIQSRFPKFITKLQCELWEKARNSIRISYDFTAYLEWLQDLSDRGETLPDIGLLFLDFQHGMCYMEEDAAQVSLTGTYSTLFDFLEDNGEELLECKKDPGIGIYETPLYKIEGFTQNTLFKVAAKCVINESKPLNHPAYVTAHLRAACELRVIKDKSGDKCKAAGYEAFRMSISETANQVYHQALKEGEAFSSAMRKFWIQVNRERNAVSVKSIRAGGEGLVLSTDRVIDWKVAVTKWNNKELSISDDQRTRLRAKLEQLGFGQQFSQLL